MIQRQLSGLLTLLLFALFSFLSAQAAQKFFPPTQKQWTNCNNCYAVVAFDILKYHQPRLNTSVKAIMQESKQTCNGGTPGLIWKLYFPRGFRKTSGSLLALRRVLRKQGPCAVNFGKGHLVTAIRANEKGVLVRDPATGTERFLSVSGAQSRKESLYFNYIAFPLL